MAKYTVFIIYCFPELGCCHGMSWQMQACYAWCCHTKGSDERKTLCLHNDYYAADICVFCQM